jgi:hypothetical protein
MSLSGRRLGFDITDADTILASDNVGAWLRAGTDGDQLSSTNVGGKEGLDVNIINPMTWPFLMVVSDLILLPVSISNNS